MNKAYRPIRLSGRAMAVSFHDVHPGTRNAAERFLASMGERGVAKVTLMLVPCWHGDPPFSADRSFTHWLQDQAAAGHDICLHGHRHQGGPPPRQVPLRTSYYYYTSGQCEFLHLPQQKALNLIEEDLDLLHHAGIRASGFIPPGWVMEDNARDRLRRKGIAYTTDLQGVYLLNKSRMVVSPLLIDPQTQGWRRGLGRLGMRLRRQRSRALPLLRVCVHHSELQGGAEPHWLYEIVSREAPRREVLTYAELARR